MTSSAEFDALRRDNPELGMAIYALQPGGPVTFEVITPNGDVYQFHGATAEAAIATAFPSPSQHAEAPAAPEPAPAASVFD